MNTTENTESAVIQNTEVHPVLMRDDFSVENLNGQSHWNIRIEYKGRSMSLDYHMGCGHRAWIQAIYEAPYKFAKGSRFSGFNIRITLHLARLAVAYTRPIKPSKLDVLYCLVMDYYPRTHTDVDDFLFDMGYEIKSREDYMKFEEAKISLMKQAADFGRLYSPGEISEIADALQDY